VFEVVDMENLLREIDKSLDSSYHVVWRDYVNRKNRLASLSGEEFAGEFVECVRVLHQLYVVMDMLFARGLISEATYRSVVKYLDCEKSLLVDLLSSRIGR